MTSVCSWDLPHSLQPDHKLKDINWINKFRRHLKTITPLWLKAESTAGHSGLAPFCHMFSVFIVLGLKSKDCCQKKDKHHQAEQETMNQVSSFPAYESAHHMLDKFFWTVTGLKVIFRHANPVSVCMFGRVSSLISQKHIIFFAEHKLGFNPGFDPGTMLFYRHEMFVWIACSSKMWWVFKQKHIKYIVWPNYPPDDASLLQQPVFLFDSALVNMKYLLWAFYFISKISGCAIHQYGNNGKDTICAVFFPDI